MILWDLEFDEWLKLWKSYKVRPYEMTGDHELTQLIIRRCKSYEELFEKFQWETIERRKRKCPKAPKQKSACGSPQSQEPSEQSGNV